MAPRSRLEGPQPLQVVDEDEFDLGDWQFEDAVSDDDTRGNCGNVENDSSHGGDPLRANANIPSGLLILTEIQNTRQAFCERGPGALACTEDVARCRDLMAKISPSFYYFSRLMGEEQRYSIWSIFGVIQALEDATTVQELDGLRVRLRSTFDPQMNSTRFAGEWGALRQVLRRYALARRPFEDFADGIQHWGLRWQSMKLKQETGSGFAGLLFTSEEELLTHVYRSAGVFGLMVLPVLAEQAFVSPSVVDAAVALGMALQLTSQLNSLGPDFLDGGSCCIPSQLLERHGLQVEELEHNLRGTSLSLVTDHRWKALMRGLLAYVPKLLLMARRGGEELPTAAKVAVRAAVRMCQRTVSRIEARDYNTFGPRESMFSWHVVGDVAGAMWSSGRDSANREESCDASIELEPGKTFVDVPEISCL